MGTYEDAINFENLYESFRFARRGSFWKDSVIGYDQHRLEETVKLHRSLADGTYKCRGYYKFNVCERGKIRAIQSLHITDRVFQRSLCDQALIKEVTKGFIYDNGASQAGKGTEFARNRLVKHMQDFYRKHGMNGYFLQIDIHKYFDSIDHEIMKKIVSKKIKDEKVAAELYRVIDSFDGGKGVGLGSQICQLFALMYLDSMDHYVKDRLSMKWYGRYMDDAWLICESKEKLQRILDDIKEVLAELKLKINEKKTQIFPIGNGIRILGFHFYIREGGSVYAKILPESIKREKRKIRRMIRKGVPEGRVRQSFVSWRASASYGDSYYKTRKVEQYMNRLLKERRLNA